jgi:dienelactone hydrolase
MRALRIFVSVLLAACSAATPATTADPMRSPSPSPLTTTALPASGRIEDLAAQFRYDAAAPLAAREVSTSRIGTVSVSEIEYGNAHGGIATATLFVPESASRLPAVVMSPGSNQPRSQVSSEGLGLARDVGAVVLVVDQSQIAMQRGRVWSFTAQDREEAIESVVDIVRGVDLLAGRADVDAKRIALHGFSYGAWLSAMAGVVDRRVSTLVLRSGGPQILTELAGATRSAESTFPAYLELMKTVDQSKYAAAIPATTAVLVQNGTADATYTAEQVRAWHAAIAGMKTARMYEGAGHGLTAAADMDRLTFLRDRLSTR